MAKDREEIIIAADVIADDKPEINVEDPPRVLPPLEIEDDVVDDRPKVDPNISELAAGVKGLQEIIRSQVEREEEGKKKPPAKKGAFPKRDIEALKKSLKDNVFDNPDEEIENLIDAKILNQVGPVLQKVIEENNELKKLVGRQQGLGSAKDKSIIERWGDEVDTLAETMPYQQAIQTTKLNHIDEIIEDRIGNVSQPQGDPAYSGAGRTVASQQRSGQVKYVPANGHTAAEFKEILRTRAIDERYLANNWLKKGWLKEVRG